MRASPQLRGLMRENTLTVDDLIWPVFVMEGTDAETPIPSMPGVARLTTDRVVRAAERALNPDLRKAMRWARTWSESAAASARKRGSRLVSP